MKRYKADRHAIQVRTDACSLAAQLLCGEVWEKNRLWATCVFFETYILEGARVTRRQMDILPKPHKAPVVRLITRED